MGRALALALIGAGACSGETENNGGDAEDFEIQLGEAITNNIAGFQQSLQRLVLAANGSGQTGVTLTPINGGFQAAVGVDVNGDGSLETTIAGTLIFLNESAGLAGGANVAITGITGGAPQDAVGSGRATLVNSSTITLTDGYLLTHTHTRENDLEVEDANLTITMGLGLPSLSGTADFEFNGLRGMLTFIPDATHGFRIQVSGNGFDTFTVP
jgi:hypothetical protein